ncbi:MAG: glycosyltransferase family 39 protein [Nitrospirae bacterium]|nr:glycosyltransferase family 39 protein [Nitrospirota bacterium]
MRDIMLKTDKIIYFIIILLIILAGVLRLYKLDFQTLDTDEIGSILISRQDLYTIIMRTVDSSKSDVPVTEPPLQYILMKFSMSLFNNDFGARLPAAILGIISIWAIFRAGMAMFNEKVGLISAFLLSVSFYHILYSQFARGYSALVLFSLLSLYYMWRGIKEQKAAPWIGFIAASTFNMYFHYAAIQVLLIEGTIFAAVLFLYHIGKERSKLTISPKAWNFFLFSLLVIGILCLFLLPNIKSTLKSRLGGGGETIPFELNFIYLKNLFARYGGGNGIPLLFYSFFFVSGVIHSLRKWMIQGTALILWILIPFVLLFKSGYQWFFHIRYLMVTFPIFLIFVAVGVVFTIEWLSTKLRPQSSLGKIIPSSILIVLFVWFSFDSLRLYYQMPARMTDWRAVADYLENHYQDDTVILIESSFSVRELKYYLKDERIREKLGSVNGDITAFKKACKENKKLFYIDNSPVFDSVVGECFQDKKTFGAKVLFELGKRELIDWDRSWFSPANIRRYFPVVYSKKDL